MKKLILYIFISFVLLSCNKEQDVIEDYASLIENVEQNGAEFTDQDWEDFSYESQDIEERMQNCSFSSEQKKEIAKLNVRLAVAIGKHSGTLLKDATKEVLNFMEGFSEGFMESINSDN